MPNTARSLRSDPARPKPADPSWCRSSQRSAPRARNGRRAAAPQIVVLGVTFAAPVQRQGQKPQRVDDIGFAAIVLANEHGQFAVKLHRRRRRMTETAAGEGNRYAWPPRFPSRPLAIDGVAADVRTKRMQMKKGFDVE